MSTSKIKSKTTVNEKSKSSQSKHRLEIEVFEMIRQKGLLLCYITLCLLEKNLVLSAVDCYTFFKCNETNKDCRRLVRTVIKNCYSCATKKHKNGIEGFCIANKYIHQEIQRGRSEICTKDLCNKYKTPNCANAVPVNTFYSFFLILVLNHWIEFEQY